ncbi:MAG: hypothetical protein ACT4QE_16540 [Anaerolineales bacterium]
MTQATPLFFGNWEKATAAECSRLYPETLQFQRNGLYQGQKDPAGTFTMWDVGTYETISDTQIKISTATDEIVTYEFTLQSNTLTFVDPEGCRFEYQRVQ